MEKDIGKIKKNETTDILVRIDDYGGKMGVTIREYVTGDRYTGFTKAGTRILAESFPDFKKLIDSITEGDLASTSLPKKSKAPKKAAKEEKSEEETEETVEESEDTEDTEEDEAAE